MTQALAQYYIAGMLLLTALLSACGSDDVSVRYGAERVLWRAEQARAGLPSHALADTGRTWSALASRYGRIAETYEGWAAWNPSSPVREDLLEVAAEARWQATRMYKALADTASIRNEIDRLVEYDAYPVPIVVRAMRRRADIAAAYGDVDPWIADLRELWTRVRHSTRWSRNLIGVPAEMVLAQTRRGEPDSIRVEHTRAIKEYEWLSTRESASLARAADLERAALLNDVGRFDDAARLLGPEVRKMMGQKSRRGDQIGFVVRAVELLTEAVSAGAAEAADLQDPLEFIVESSADVARVHAALVDAYLARGETQKALETIRLIRRRFDDAVWGPRVTRTEAELYARSGRWKQTLVAIDLLRTRYALTPEALDAPLALRRMLAEAGDPLGATRALEDAIAEYRSLRERYPRGTHSDRLTLRLSEALELRGATDEAFALRLEWIDVVRDRAAELERLAETVRVGRRMQRPESEIRPLLVRIAALFPGTRLGARAARELQSPEP